MQSYRHFLQGKQPYFIILKINLQIVRIKVSHRNEIKNKIDTIVSTFVFIISLSIAQKSEFVRSVQLWSVNQRTTEAEVADL
jgi:hypothetical protein